MTHKNTLHLAENISIPTVGFGTYLISDEDASKAVFNAIRAGYRHIDTAEVYKNEAGVGIGIASALKNEGLSREQIFVTTKLWPGNREWGETPKTFQTTIDSLNSSLHRLNLDFVDLYLIHAAFDKNQRLEQWRGLIELKRQGKTRAIGVSNFNEKHIEEIKTAGLPLPSANQIEVHPWSQKPLLVKYLCENSIQIIAYSSLLPLSTWRADQQQANVKTEQMKIESIIPEFPFRVMAEKYKVSEAQVLLRWAVQKGYAILPKSINVERLKLNMDVFSFSIDESDMLKIEKMDKGAGVAWPSGDPTKNA